MKGESQRKTKRSKKRRDKKRPAFAKKHGREDKEIGIKKENRMIKNQVKQ